MGLGKRLAHKRNTIIQFLLGAKLFIGTPKVQNKVLLKKKLAWAM